MRHHISNAAFSLPDADLLSSALAVLGAIALVFRIRSAEFFGTKMNSNDSKQNKIMD